MGSQEPGEQQVRPAGWLMPALWLAVAAFGSLIALGVVVVCAIDSETAGINATMAVAFPLGLLWSGALAGVVIHLMHNDKPAVRIAAPFGCGCLGGLVLFALVALFFVAIFPAL